MICWGQLLAPLASRRRIGRLHRVEHEECRSGQWQTASRAVGSAEFANVREGPGAGLAYFVVVVETPATPRRPRHDCLVTTQALIVHHAPTNSAHSHVEFKRSQLSDFIVLCRMQVPSK